MAAQQQKENYQRVLDQTIEQLTKEGKVPTLLLHSCCAPWDDNGTIKADEQPVIDSIQITDG